MGYLITIAIRNLRQARGRTLLLGSALAMVTMLLVMLLSLSQGIQDTMIRSATTLSAGHVNVAGFFKVRKTESIPLVTDFAEIKEIIRENTSGVDFITDRNRGWARIISDTSTVYAALYGIDIRQEKRFAEIVQLAPESAYREGGRAQVVGNLADLTEPKTVLLFAAQAKRLGLTVGDNVTIVADTAGGRTNTLELRVVAVAEDMGFLSSFSAFMSKEAIPELYQLTPSATGAIQVYLKDPADSDATLASLRDLLAQKGYTVMDHVPTPFFMKFETVNGEDWIGQRLDLTTWSDEVSFLQWVITAVNTVSVVLVGILTIIIVVGIMNALWVAVRDRTNEIGTLRAIGMTRSRVLRMFMIEAFVLGCLSTTVGGLAGAIIAWGIDAANIKIPVMAVKAILMSNTINLSVNPAHVMLSIFAFTLVTVLAALWPAAKAARMQPVTAIHAVR